MSRTISRPFGRQSSNLASSSAPQQTASSSSTASASDYLLQDRPDDTPHDIHPHAAAYASQPPVPPLQTASKTKTLRQMNHAERAAWAQLAGKSAPVATAPEGPPAAPDAATTSTSSAPARYYSAPQAEQSAYTYGNSAQPWSDENEHLQLRYQPWAQATPPASPTASAPSGAPQQPVVTGSAPSQPATPTLRSPLVLAPPVRTSSLSAAAAPQQVAGSSSRRVPELEIVISRPGAQDVTIRMFAPGSR